MLYLECCQYFIICILSYREDCLMCCPTNKVNKRGIMYKTFSSSQRVTRRRIMRHFTGNGTGQLYCRNGPPNILIPYREQSRSARIVIANPRPAFSATAEWTNHTPISFDQQAQVSQGPTMVLYLLYTDILCTTIYLITYSIVFGWFWLWYVLQCFCLLKVFWCSCSGRDMPLATTNPCVRAQFGSPSPIL